MTPLRRLTCCLLLASPLAAAGAAELPVTRTRSPEAIVRDVAPPSATRRLLGTGAGLLLVPDSTNDRIMAFDAATGDLVDANLVPTDPVNLATPKNAILNAARDRILVADQIRDVVQAYNLDGSYVGVYAPAGGPNPAILDNIIGIDLRPNGNLLVTVTGGTNQDSVAEFDSGGNYLGNFIAVGAGGIDGPFDVYSRATDWLVTSITSDDLNSFDLDGGFLSQLAPLDNFPQQIAEAANGNLLIGNFSGLQEGVVELTPDGSLVGVYNPAAVGGNRGVYELANGNILTTNGAGVHEIDRAGNLVESKITGVSAQYIEPTAPPQPEIVVPGIVAFPVIDGVLAAGEWDGALAIDMTLGASPVTLYLAHRGAGLFVAVDDQLDSTLDAGDQIGVHFDDEGGVPPLLADGAFATPACGAPNTGEGNFWLGNLAPDPDDLYQEWIVGPTTCPLQSGGTGVAIAYGAGAGHVAYEAVIPFGDSALTALSGQTFGLRVQSADTGTVITGRWPDPSAFDDPGTYGLVTLDGLLFADGFESGDTSWWSLVVP